MKTQRMTLPIYGLTCGGGGALTVEHVLEKAPGVVRVYVNPALEMAYIEYNPDRSAPADLVTAAERVGFRAGAPSLR